jgi:hypothetical protein
MTIRRTLQTICIQSNVLVRECHHRSQRSIGATDDVQDQGRQVQPVSARKPRTSYSQQVHKFLLHQKFTLSNSGAIVISPSRSG